MGTNLRKGFVEVVVILKRTQTRKKEHLKSVALGAREKLWITILEGKLFVHLLFI
jgi:hypothetical protein